jgi:hypothetical protein
MNKITFNLHYNNKVKLFIFLTLILAHLFCTNCNRQDQKQDLHIIIKDENGVEITDDTVSVVINSVHQTVLEVVYERGAIQYLRKIDQVTIEELSDEHDDLQFLSHGMNEYSNQFEKAIITTRFADTLVHAGSIVKISVRISTNMVKSTFYKVTE